MILAKKNGWLIAVDVIRRTRNGVHVKPIDTGKTFFVSSKDASSKLFDQVDDAVAFALSA